MAAHGDDRRSVDELLAAMASLAARTADTYPLVRAVTVSTPSAVDAGATAVQEPARMPPTLSPLHFLPCRRPYSFTSMRYRESEQ